MGAARSIYTYETSSTHSSALSIARIADVNVPWKACSQQSLLSILSERVMVKHERHCKLVELQSQGL
jgi:hypothetical protein